VEHLFVSKQRHTTTHTRQQQKVTEVLLTEHAGLLPAAAAPAVAPAPEPAAAAAGEQEAGCELEKEGVSV
jgi:hypothetical protein